MKKLVSFLDGKKTFIVAAVLFLQAVVVTGWQNGDWNAAIDQALLALGLGALRDGIRKLK